MSMAPGSQNSPPVAPGEVVVLREGGSESPLLCLYGLSLYRELAVELNTSRAVCGVHVPPEKFDKANRALTPKQKEPAIVEAIVDAYLTTILAYQPNGPYYLAGHSFGGVVCLEVARRLQERGAQVPLLAMFDSYVPSLVYSIGAWQRARAHLAEFGEQGLPYMRKKLLLKLERQLRFWPVAPEVAQLHRQRDLRLNIRRLAGLSYRPTCYSGRVVLFRATDRSAFAPRVEDGGWSAYIPDLHVHTVSGDHMVMLDKEHVHFLARELEFYLQ